MMPIWFKDPMKSLIGTDTTLYQATDNAVELTAALEGDLIRLVNWVIDNGLVLNESKTQLLLLARKCKARELDNIKVTLSGQEKRKLVLSVCMGVIID